MVEELKASDEIEGSEDMGGFTLPPEGNIAKGSGVLMEFTSEIKSCVSDEGKKGLLFNVVYCDDPSARAMIYCSLETQSGLAKIVGIGRDSGVFDRIDKKRIAQSKTPIQSADGKVKVKNLTNEKFHEQLRKEIEGCSILCTINHTEAKPYKDKDTGEEKEGFPQANISKIASAKKGSGRATGDTEKQQNDTPAGDDEFE
jgi:CDGSH-type Zn-finger protein